MRPARDTADGDRHLVWLVAVAVLLGAADWIATWLLIEETAVGTSQVAGLSEGNLRALQNPATVLLLLALSATWRHYASRRGELQAAALTVTALALAVVLVGNVVEFGLWGEGPLESQDPGAAIFFTGLLVLAVGLVLLAISAAAGWWRGRRER
jgi:hypothetical protein